ncbi:class I SAM-dependent methyltransferase [Candidatus Gottesmanbacteria bacterium]|nr:class I SAM-dependent methyltransferase [Candidatus Gottesmanbacteria bacterium]
MGNMIATVCALCGKNQDTRELYPATFGLKSISHATFSARRVPDQVHYRLVKCDRCGLIFSNPIFSPAEITKFYHRSICTYDEQITYVTETYLASFEMIRRKIPKQPKVLEVGCGNAFFLEKLRVRIGAKVWGVEPGESMVAQAPASVQKHIICDIFKPHQFKNNTFDVVFCFHTLDHMTDPNSFVREAFRILKPGGFVMVVVHDTDGWSVKLFGERSPIFDIEHIYLFNKKTLAQLFRNHKFGVVDAFDLRNTYPVSYWLRMSGFPSYVKEVGQKVLSILGLSHIPFSFPGGNIAFIAQKPR